LIIFFSGIHW